MRLGGQIWFAWRAVRRNRLRSALMMLAIVIGIADLTVLSSIGQATRQETLARFKNMLGTFDTLIVRPGAGSAQGMTSLAESDATLTFDDASAVAAAPFARNVIEVENALKVDSSYRDRHFSPAVFGVSAAWAVVRGESLAEGHFLTARDEQALSRVAVLGADARRDLFGDSDALGKTIRIGDVPFQVKGALNPRGAGPTGASLDDLIFIPVTTAAKRLFNRDYLTMLIVQLKDPQSSTLRARAKVDAQFVALGAELIVVTPRPPMSALSRLRGKPVQITPADYAALARELPGVRASASAVLSLRVEGGAFSRKTQVVGVEPAFFLMKHWRVRAGRPFAAEDNRHVRRLALLGNLVAAALFGDEDPVGAPIIIGRVPFRVAGVLAARGQSIDSVDEDDQVYVPLQSLMHRLSDTRGYSSLTFDAGTVGRIEPLARRIAAILTARHRSDSATAFRVQDRKSTIDAQTATFARLSALSRGAALALYAMAAVGIFATSWIAVGARRVQIGTLRALGAKRVDVLVGFWLEGALPSIAGCMTGWAVSALLVSLAKLQLAFVPGFAPAVSLASGVVFGALSAVAAARGASVSPTEAMRSD